jgi:Tol biopolymer transport system component
MRITLLSILFFVSLYTSAQIKGSSPNNSYFNQPSPSDTPVLFAPNIISNDLGNRDMAISPEGDELFYTIQYGRGLISVIMHSKKMNGKWSKPEIASFSGIYNDLEPAFSFDGTKLFFVSNRALNNGNATKDYDIWFVTKQNGEWIDPQNIGALVNSEKDEFYPSLTKNGDIYFTRAVDGREEDILFCKFSNGKYKEAQALPDVINSVNDEFNAFIDPDEQFIIFSVYGRKDDNGGGDLYISKKNENGEWMPAKNLKMPVNSKYLDYCPYITPDKKYFFFTSNRHKIKIPFSKKQNIQSLQTLLHSPLNGYDNIYWMSTKNILSSQ